MGDINEKILEAINYVWDNIETIFAEKFGEEFDDEKIEEYLISGKMNYIYNKYYSSLIEYSNDPNFIPSLIKDNYSKDVIERVLISIAWFFPKDIYRKTIIYYKDKIENIINYSYILNKEDIDFFKSIGYSEIDIANSSGLSNNEEALEYLASLKTVNGKVEENLYKALLNNKIGHCLFLVINELKKGNYEILKSYINEWGPEERTKKLVIALLKEKLPNTSSILDRILIKRYGNNSVIEDQELAKELIRSYGSKYLVFIDNPNEEIISMIDDFKLEDYVNRNGNYKNSPFLLKYLIERGDYDAINYTNPAAITTEIINYLLSKGVELEQYPRNKPSPLNMSLAYNKYLVSSKGIYDRLYFLEDIYTNVETFNFVYECLSKVDVDDYRLDLINYILGKKENETYLTYVLSTEVAERIVELGLTFEQYLNIGIYSEQLLELYIKNGEEKAKLLINNNNLKYITNITYEDYLELKKTTTKFYLSSMVGLKFVNEGHYDVFDNLDDGSIGFIIRENGYDELTKKEYEALPSKIKDLKQLKVLFPSKEEIIKKLKEKRNVENTVIAIRVGVPYEEIVKILEEDPMNFNTIPAQYVVKFLKEGHRDAILYLKNTLFPDERLSVAEAYYEAMNGELPTQEEWEGIELYMKDFIAYFYIIHGKYEVISLNNNKAGYVKSIDFLIEQGFNIEDFQKTPLLEAPIIQYLLEKDNNNIDIIIEQIEKIDTTIEDSSDLILFLYRSNIPREKIKKIISRCNYSITDLLLVMQDDEMELLNYLNLESSLNQSSIISTIIDVLNPKKIEDLLQSDIHIYENNLLTIINSMVERGYYSFIRFYNNTGSERTIRKAIISGYMPSVEEIQNSSFLKKRILVMTLSPEEKEIIRTYIANNPIYIILLLDDYRDDKTKIKDCIIKDPNIIELLPEEYRKDVSLVTEISKENPQLASKLMNNLSEEDNAKIIITNPEIIKFLPSNILTDRVHELVIPNYPQIIDRYENYNEKIFEYAFKNDYTLSKKSTGSVILYAFIKDMQLSKEIWTINNIDYLLVDITPDIYSKSLEKYNKVFDDIYSTLQENFISKIIEKVKYYELKIKLLERYGYTNEDYHTFSNTSDNEVRLFLISLKKIENLSENEQIEVISEYLDEDKYRKNCLDWLNKHGLTKRASLLSKEKFDSDPITYISHILEEDIDSNIIKKAKNLIISNPEEYHSLVTKINELLSDEEVVLKVLTIDTNYYASLPEKMMHNNEVIKVLLETDYSKITLIPKDVHNYKELCYEALEKGGEVYPKLSPLHADKKALKIALKNYGEAIYSADSSIIDDEIIEQIEDLSKIDLQRLSIENAKKFIFSNKYDINIHQLALNVMNLAVNNKEEFPLEGKILSAFLVLLKINSELVYKRFFAILKQLDESYLTEEQIEEKNNAIKLLEAYGKVNALDKNPVFSYDVVKYVLPFFGIDDTVNLLRYDSKADSEIITLIKNREAALAVEYFEFIKKNQIFVKDEKMIHFAFRYFSDFKELIKNIIKENLTSQEITNLIKVIMNRNPYKIKTKNELTKYEEIVKEYANKMLESTSTSELKEYLSKLFGFRKIEELITFFDGHQLDNFAQLQFIIKEIKNAYGEDLAKSLLFTSEELKVIVLMKEIIETDDINQLHRLLRLNIDKNNEILDYANIVNDITLRIRKAYNYQFNARLSKVKELKGKQSTYKRVITDDKGEKKEANVTIIDMDEEPFKFLVSRIHAFDMSMTSLAKMLMEHPSLWTQLDGASTLSTSSISDLGFWMLEHNNPDGVIYIFDSLPESFLLYMYGRDLCVQHGGYKLEPTYNSNSYTDIDSLNQASCYHHYEWNEVAGYRLGMMPSAILCNGIEPNEEQMRAADYFGIPIIRVNIQKYEEKKIKKYDETKKQMTKCTTKQAIHDVMYSGMNEKSLEKTIDYCIECIRNSYTAKKIDFKEMLSQLIEVRAYATRISESGSKKTIRKINLMIQTLALERNVSKEELISIEVANMGETGIMYKQHIGGKEFLLKPSVDKQELKNQPYRAEVQKAASRLQTILSPDTAVEVEVIGDGPLRISKQEKIQLSENQSILKDWINNKSELESRTIRQLLQEYVVDYLLCNFDCFEGNFVIDSKGNLRGVDKEQAFRFIDDERTLDPNFSYMPNGAGRTPIYKILFERYQSGQIDLDFTIIDEKIALLKEMSDDEYMKIFKSYAIALNKENPEIVLAKILERKKICVEKMEEFINSIRKDKKDTEGMNM